MDALSFYAFPLFLQGGLFSLDYFSGIYGFWARTMTMPPAEKYSLLDSFLL